MKNQDEIKAFKKRRNQLGLDNVVLDGEIIRFLAKSGWKVIGRNLSHERINGGDQMEIDTALNCQLILIQKEN